jgi:ABC-type nitrate/sulfonate/bicarbonate transport system ATPase subunit
MKHIILIVKVLDLDLEYLSAVQLRITSLIVIDEPFTKMDEETKSELYFLIRKVSKEYKISFLFATTNISEALILADKVYLMKKNPGEVFQNIEIVFHDERNINIIMSEEFIQLRTQIENAFKTVDTQKLFNISI